MKISVELLDGEPLECEANPKTWMCLADRIAFREQFGVAPNEMALWSDLFTDGDDGGRTIRPDADPELLGRMREDYLLFFAWRELTRRLDKAKVPAFAQLAEQAGGLTIDASDGDAADPT